MEHYFTEEVIEACELVGAKYGIELKARHFRLVLNHIKSM
jgi:hypothetical protein